MYLYTFLPSQGARLNWPTCAFSTLDKLAHIFGSFFGGILATLL